MKLKMTVGLVNEEGVGRSEVIDSPLLLANLRSLIEEDGTLFNSMTDTDPSVVYPEEYEEACRQLGLLQGFVEQAARGAHHG